MVALYYMQQTLANNYHSVETINLSPEVPITANFPWKLSYTVSGSSSIVDRGGLYCILADFSMAALINISIAGSMIREKVAILSRNDIIILILANATNFCNADNMLYYISNQDVKQFIVWWGFQNFFTQNLYSALVKRKKFLNNAYTYLKVPFNPGNSLIKTQFFSITCSSRHFI